MSFAIQNRRPAWRQLLLTEAKLFLREPMALFWGVLFPLVLIVVFGIAGHHPDRNLGGQSLVDAYVPVMMAFVLTVVAVQVLPSILATYREKGVLRRLSTTPIHPRLLLGADVVVLVTVIVTALLVIAVVARVAFNAHLPSQAAGFVLTLALAAVAMLGLGAVVASISGTPRIANAIGTLLFFPMMFFAGLWVPRQTMPSALLHISDYTPLGAATAAIQDTMRGHWPGVAHLGALAVYALVLSFAASRLFRWE
jgi:ABC-2 type transport system permease protein